MTATVTRWTLAAIKRANKAAGLHWFEPATLEFFNSVVHKEDIFAGPAGVFFVSSEKDGHNPRRWSVRQFDPTDGSIDTVGEFQAHANHSAAKFAANRAAKGLK
jgi:hypothetical protein